MKRYILLDRDGTLIEDRHYLANPEKVVLIPGAAMGLRSLAGAGFGLVVITNQSGIARGLFDRAAMDAVHEAMKGLLAREGVALDGVYACPHMSADRCACRKPLPGLALAAGRDLGFDPSESIVVGDKACDMGLGRALSAATILVGTARDAEGREEALAMADTSVPSIAEACGVILEWEKSGALRASRGEQNG